MEDRFSRDLLLKNLRTMRNGAQLLKFGATGKPKFREFRLSSDNKQIEWHSKNKAADDTRLSLTSIIEIRFGQRTPKFKRNNRKDLEHLSFSIVYRISQTQAAVLQRQPTKKNINGLAGFAIPDEADSLDLVCKDEQEFQAWAETLVALHKGKVESSILEQLEKITSASKSPIQGTSQEQIQRTVSQQHKEAFQETNDCYAFGWCEWGQTGLGANVSAVDSPRIVEALLGKGVVQIACGWSHTTILLETGAVMQCGNRLGTGLDSDFFVPSTTAITSKLGVMTVACGSFHSMALTETGQVLTWGCNVHGQLGHGDSKDVNVPTVLRSFEDDVIEDISARDHASMAVGSGGSLYTWGSGAHGFTGHDSTEDVLVPKKVHALAGASIKKIACGNGFMFACTERETYGWGWNACGQLGLNNEEDQLRPHSVDALRGSRVLDIACGAAHTIAIVTVAKLGTHVLYSWGSNAMGQLGQPNKNIINKPAPVILMNNLNLDLVEVACGDMHSIVRTGKGHVFACGSNKYGQLGMGNSSDLHEFKEMDVFKDKEVRSVVCGGEHSAVLTARKWVDDEEVKECMQCKTPFTMITRKHHCRNCFGIFCNDCSSKKVAILSSGKTEKQRVCNNCFDRLTRAG